MASLSNHASLLYTISLNVVERKRKRNQKAEIKNALANASFQKNTKVARGRFVCHPQSAKTVENCILCITNSKNRGLNSWKTPWNQLNSEKKQSVYNKMPFCYTQTRLSLVFSWFCELYSINRGRYSALFIHGFDIMAKKDNGIHLFWYGLGRVARERFVCHSCLLLRTGLK